MKNCDIIMNSITYVYKAQGILDSRRIRSRVVRLAVTNTRRGCGYGLSVAEDRLSDALDAITQAGVEVVEVLKK